MLSKEEGKILCQEGVRPRRVVCGRINDDDVQILSQCAGRPATSSRCKSDTMKE